MKLVYLSGAPDSRGHAYRVENAVRAMRSIEVDASWFPLAESVDLTLDDCDVLIVFRGRWSPLVDRLVSTCRARGMLIGFDIDDLIFLPELMVEQHVDFLRSLNTEERQRWQDASHGYRDMLLACDFFLAPTAPLCEVARTIGKPAFTIPNGLSHAFMAGWHTANASTSIVDKGSDHVVRIGYASGTPTHQRDFAVVAHVVAELLRRFEYVQLSLVGHLDITEFPELKALMSRIEMRPVVPHHRLALEYARFNINLAPLALDVPFSHCKSELKYFEAGYVGVPTVASPSQPFRAAIVHGTTGYVAHTADEWRETLAQLIESPAKAAELGRQAAQDAMFRYGTEAQQRWAMKFIAEISNWGHRF